MSHPADTAFGVQKAFWDQVVELKTLAVVMRLYRDDQARWASRIGVLKGIGSASTIAAWAIWKDYAMIWAIFLGLVQVLDAIKDYLPQIKNQRAANELLALADSLFIEARYDWHVIYSGRLTADEIMERWRMLAKRQQEAEMKCFPLGLIRSKKHLALAFAEVRTYFGQEFGSGEMG